MDPTTSSTCETRAADAPSAPAPMGRAHWRSVEELQQTPEFRSFLDRDQPYVFDYAI